MAGLTINTPMVSLLLHGATVAALPGTSQLLTLWVPSYLCITSACAAPAAESAAERKEKEFPDSACNYHFFPLPSSQSVPLIRSVRISFLHWAIAFHPTPMTDERNFSFSNAFLLLRFNAVCFVNSFGNIDVKERRSQPRHTHIVIFSHLHNFLCP